MLESDSPRFSGSELREIVKLTDSPQSLRKMAVAVRKAYRFVETRPDFSWDEFTEATPNIEDLEGRGKGTLAEVREKLQVPDDVTISRLRFAPDCCVLLMDVENTTRYYRFLQAQNGYQEMDDVIVNGFAGSSLYLSDPQENVCGVVVADKSWRSVTDHEVQHDRFARYYLRREYAQLVPSMTTVEDQVKTKASMVFTKDKSLEEIQFDAYQLTEQLLSPYKQMLVDEILAKAAETQYATQLNFEIVANYFQPHPIGKAQNDHPYGRGVAQKIQGIVNSIYEQQISPEDKMKLWWNIEEWVAKFLLYNEAIAVMANHLWDNCRGQKRVFVSQFEAVPIARHPSLTFFLKDDNGILNDLQHRQNGLYERVLWSMMISRMMSATPHIRKQHEGLGLSLEKEKSVFFLDLYDELSGLIGELQDAGIIESIGEETLTNAVNIYVRHIYTENESR